MSSLCDDFDDSDDMEVGFDGIRSLCVTLDFFTSKITGHGNSRNTIVAMLQIHTTPWNNDSR